ncbi:MAG: alanyl-tRNA editing protein [Pseudomonadota bacterium]
MSALIFLEDAYQREASAQVLCQTDDGGIVLDHSLFYPMGGGQPGDTGILAYEGRGIPIKTTIKGPQGIPVLIPEEGATLPEKGAKVDQTIDWATRYGHMRVHTALHLLSVVIPLPVTGGQISAQKGRLDFLMPDPPADKQPLEDALNALIVRDLPVTQTWISEAELDAKPGLVKTMSVKPPKGAGQIRLVRIGTEEDQIDLQPCGGTHVHKTGEIGRIRFGKIENKGKQNRRVHIHLEDS